MSNLEPFNPRGMLHDGWTSQVDDFAIACGWAKKGNIFLVGGSAGGLYAFNGSNGKSLWNKESSHQEGLLALDINPEGDNFATSGQDGAVRFWNSENGNELNFIDLGKGWVEHLCWSPDGKYLAIAFSRTVYVLSLIHI